MLLFLGSDKVHVFHWWDLQCQQSKEEIIRDEVGI
jgi:hypothetical protein